MKKTLALISSLFLLSMIFGGCGDDKAKGKNDSELIDNTYVSGFPIVKNKETLKIMTTKLPNHGDFDTMSFNTYYEDMTNIKIDWMLVTPEDMDNSVTLALATGDLPDVISLVDGRLGASNVITYGSNGTLIPLENLIEQYGTNIIKAFEKYPELKMAATEVDGHIYTLPSADMRDGSQLRFPAKLYIRQPWLDNLNLEVPTTVEQFYDVLVAFKNDDPNGNGQADEIPFIMPGIQDAFFGSWGVSINMTNRGFTVNNEGKVGYGYATNSCKNALTFLNRLYNQELVEMIPSDVRWRSRIRSGLVGVFYGLDKYVMAGDDLGDEYTMIAPFSAEDGSVPTTSVSNRIVPFSYAITSECRNPSAALRWVDYFYSVEGAMLITYGAPGDYIQKDENNKYEIVEENQNIDRFTFTPGYVLPFYWDSEFSDAFKDLDVSEMTTQQLRDKELNDDVKRIYFNKYEPKNEIGIIKFDKQALDVIDKYYQEIYSYALHMVNSFANGTENVETGWETYIQELNRKGLSEVLAEYQRLYDLKYSD